MRKLFLIGGCWVAALALSACGGDESDEDQIVSAIETSATSTDPTECEALNTRAFMEQTEFEEGQDAVKSCEESAEDTSDNPDSVTVDNVKVDGSEATADAAIAGGNFDGQTLTIALVEEDGEWKLDELKSFVVFDRGKLLAGFEETLEKESEGEDTEVASCILEELEEAPDEEVEEAVLSPDAFIALAEDCIAL